MNYDRFKGNARAAEIRATDTIFPTISQLNIRYPGNQFSSKYAATQHRPTFLSTHTRYRQHVNVM